VGIQQVFIYVIRNAPLWVVSNLAIIMKKSFNVALDTNIYRNCPKMDNLDFQAIERLSKSGFIQIHAPYVVQREFQTQQSSACKEHINVAKKGLSDLVRKHFSPKLKDEIQNISAKLEKIEQQVLDDAEKHFDEWLKKVGGQLHEITSDDATESLEHYFNGTGPVKEAKLRKDIPDAFIYQTLDNLRKGDSDLVFICKDAYFRNAVETNLKGILCYDSITNFIEDPIIKSAIQLSEASSDPTVLLNLLKEIEKSSQSISKQFTSSDIDDLANMHLSDSEFDSDDNEATIVSYNEPTDINFTWDEYTYFGDGDYGIPFTFQVEVGISMLIFKADYYCLDEEDTGPISDWNDHYFEMERVADVKVDAIMAININLPVITSVDQEDLKSNFTINIDKINDVSLT
jgi:hypothetical protein